MLSLIMCISKSFEYLLLAGWSYAGLRFLRLRQEEMLMNVNLSFVIKKKKKKIAVFLEMSLRIINQSALGDKWGS